MPARYVIMANGKGTRWNEHLGVPKHLLEIGGETLLARIVRQVRAADPEAEVIISSDDPRYEVPGARRYSPLRNEIELDRFVPELITDDVCFLYGDTYYTDETMKSIVQAEATPFAFFANKKSIVAVKCVDPRITRQNLLEVRVRFLSGEFDTCKGWQLYAVCRSQYLHDIRESAGQLMTRVTDSTGDFNEPDDYENLCESVQVRRELSTTEKRRVKVNWRDADAKF